MRPPGFGISRGLLYATIHYCPPAQARALKKCLHLYTAGDEGEPNLVGLLTVRLAFPNRPKIIISPDFPFTSEVGGK
jgi:hypothetical protein